MVTLTLTRRSHQRRRIKPTPQKSPSPRRSISSVSSILLSLCLHLNSIVPKRSYHSWPASYLNLPLGKPAKSFNFLVWFSRNTLKSFITDIISHLLMFINICIYLCIYLDFFNPQLFHRLVRILDTDALLAVLIKAYCD